MQKRQSFIQNDHSNISCITLSTACSNPTIVRCLQNLDLWAISVQGGQEGWKGRSGWWERGGSWCGEDECAVLVKEGGLFVQRQVQMVFIVVGDVWYDQVHHLSLPSGVLRWRQVNVYADTGSVYFLITKIINYQKLYFQKKYLIKKFNNFFFFLIWILFSIIKYCDLLIGARYIHQYTHQCQDWRIL